MNTENYYEGCDPYNPAEDDYPYCPNCYQSYPPTSPPITKCAVCDFDFSKEYVFELPPKTIRFVLRLIHPYKMAGGTSGPGEMYWIGTEPPKEKPTKQSVLFPPINP